MVVLKKAPSSRPPRAPSAGRPRERKGQERAPFSFPSGLGRCGRAGPVVVVAAAGPGPAPLLTARPGPARPLPPAGGGAAASAAGLPRDPSQHLRSARRHSARRPYPSARRLLLAPPPPPAGRRERGVGWGLRRSERRAGWRAGG